MERIAITGSSGYFGRKMVALLRQAQPQARLLGIDVAPAKANATDEFVQADVRDAAAIRAALERFRPDTVLHLAFIVNPMHDEKAMHAVNIEGSRNVLSAVAAVKPRQLMVAGSATAFGAWPDNPVPMPDTFPTRARKEFLYAADKTELDHMVAAFAEQHGDIAVAWVRPAIIYGPGTDNYLSRMLLFQPVVMLADGFDLPMQFVHEDDVAAATLKVLEAGARGPFNLGPPDWIHLSEAAQVLGKRVVHVPFRVMQAIAWLGWTLKLKNFEAPPGILWFFKYPWVMQPKRLVEELGYTFQHGSRDTLADMVRTHR